MKKIINKKRYDTDTAQKIGEVWDGLPTDAYFTHEALYRKRTGEFFFFCEGGAKSVYGEWECGEGHTGKTIQLFSYEQAETWAMNNLDADTYEKFFEVIDDDGETETISIVIPVSAASKLRIMVSQTGKTYGEIINDLLNENFIDKK